MSSSSMVNNNNTLPIADLINDLTCGICLAVVTEPVVTQCCRRLYCRHCIEQWLNNTGGACSSSSSTSIGHLSRCPLDRRPLTVQQLRKPSLAITNMLTVLNKHQIKLQQQKRQQFNVMTSSSSTMLSIQTIKRLHKSNISDTIDTNTLSLILCHKCDHLVRPSDGVFMAYCCGSKICYQCWEPVVLALGSNNSSRQSISTDDSPKVKQNSTAEEEEVKEEKEVKGEEEVKEDKKVEIGVNCPKCMEKLSEPYVQTLPPIVAKLLLGLHVKCVFSHRGCGQLGTIDYILDEHQVVCEHRPKHYCTDCGAEIGTYGHPNNTGVGGNDMTICLKYHTIRIISDEIRTEKLIDNITFRLNQLNDKFGQLSRKINVYLPHGDSLEDTDNRSPNQTRLTTIDMQTSNESIYPIESFTNK